MKMASVHPPHYDFIRQDFTSLLGAISNEMTTCFQRHPFAPFSTTRSKITSQHALDTIIHPSRGALPWAMGREVSSCATFSGLQMSLSTRSDPSQPTHTLNVTLNIRLPIHGWCCPYAFDPVVGRRPHLNGNGMRQLCNLLLVACRIAISLFYCSGQGMNRLIHHPVHLLQAVLERRFQCHFSRDVIKDCHGSDNFVFCVKDRRCRIADAYIQNRPVSSRLTAER